MRYGFLNNKMRAILFALGGFLIIPSSQAGDINFSGFLSVGGGFVDDEEGLEYQGYDEEDFSLNKNIFGFQMSGEVSDKLTATIQLIARGEEDYEVDAEWAYLSYELTDQSKLRIGRLRTPFYIYSDFLDVGYAYPWIRPPREVYYLPFNNIDGIDYYLTAALGPLDTTFEMYFGGFDDVYDFDGTAAEAKTRNQMGVAGTIGRDWLTLRAAYHQADFSLDVANAAIAPDVTVGDFAGTLAQFGYPENGNNLLIEEDTATFIQFGINIDTGMFVAAAEHVEFEVEDSLLSKNVREYVMAGLRISDFLFHVTAAQSKDEVASPEEGIPANVTLPVIGNSNVLIGTARAIAQAQVIERDVLTVGVRWDLSSGMALKLQMDDIDDEADGEQKVFSVALQTVF